MYFDNKDRIKNVTRNRYLLKSVAFESFIMFVSGELQDIFKASEVIDIIHSSNSVQLCQRALHINVHINGCNACIVFDVDCDQS